MPTRHGVLDQRLTTLSTEYWAASTSMQFAGPRTNYNITSVRPTDRNIEIMNIQSIQFIIRRQAAATTPGRVTLVALFQYTNGFFPDQNIIELNLESNNVGASSTFLYAKPFTLMRALFDENPPYEYGVVQGHQFVSFNVTDTSVGGNVYYTINVLAYGSPNLAPQTLLPW